MLGEDHIETAGGSSDLRTSPANMAKPMILVPGAMRRRVDAVSTPFSIGMLRSRRMRSQLNSLALSMAATLSPASPQTL